MLTNMFSHWLTILIITFTLTLTSPLSMAQSDEENTGNEDDFSYEIPEDFDGTFAIDEDEDAEGYDEYKKETELFGDPNEEPDENVEPISDDPNYLLTFTYEGTATFYDYENNEAYMEIVYRTQVEQEVALINRRFRVTGEAVYESDIVGNYAGNEMFTCKLEIEIASSEVDIMTRMRTEVNEDEDEITQVALQMKFEKSYKEDWYSLCTGIDGSTFNTQGDPEKYNQIILEESEPSLGGLLIEDFYFGDSASIDIETENLEISEEFSDTIVLTGSGNITLDPL